MAGLVDADYLGLIGKSFSVPEKSAMKLSLLVLSEKIHSKVAVWGKVMGINADYLVANTIPDVITEPRLYYYSVDGGSNWSLLPTADLSEEQKGLAEEIRGRFFGLPDFEYKVRKDVPPEAKDKSLVPPAEGDLVGKEGEDEEGEEGDDADEEDEENEEEGEENGDEEDEEFDEDELRRLKTKPKYRIIKMKESARLAHFVLIHDEACRLVLRGAFVLNEKTNQMVRNRTFEGVDVAQSVKLRSFFKVSSFPKDDPVPAAPTTAEGEEEGAAAPPADEDAAPAPTPLTAEEKKAIISENNRKWFGPSYAYTTDFLQPIAEDQPNGVWIVKYDATLPAVSVQNLYFNGSLFYYVPDSTTFGQFYYGTGERNLDLCFQLPC